MIWRFDIILKRPIYIDRFAVWEKRAAGDEWPCGIWHAWLRAAQSLDRMISFEKLAKSYNYGARTKDVERRAKKRAWPTRRRRHRWKKVTVRAPFAISRSSGKKRRWSTTSFRRLRRSKMKNSLEGPTLITRGHFLITSKCFSSNSFSSKSFSLSFFLSLNKYVHQYIVASHTMCATSKNLYKWWEKISRQK